MTRFQGYCAAVGKSTGLLASQARLVLQLGAPDAAESRKRAERELLAKSIDAVTYRALIEAIDAVQEGYHVGRRCHTVMTPLSDWAPLPSGHQHIRHRTLGE